MTDTSDTLTRRASWRRWHLCKDSKEVRKQAMQKCMGKNSRQRKEPVQRSWGGGTAAVFEKNMERTSMARAEAIWGSSGYPRLLLVMNYNPVRYHRCALTEHFQHPLLLYTPLSWHLSPKSAEIGGWVVFSEKEGGSLSISTAVHWEGRAGLTGGGKVLWGTENLSSHLPWCCPQVTWQPAQQQLCRPLPSYTSVALSVSSLLEPKRSSV